MRRNYPAGLVTIFLLFTGALFSYAPRSLLLTSPKYDEGAGLFHNFHMVLGALDFYDQHAKCSLEVDFGREGLYFEEAYGSNWWNYYFEPIKLAAKEDLNRKKRPLIFPDSAKAFFGNSVYFYYPRQKVYKIIQKYIKIKPSILEEVTNFQREHFSEVYTIGVHYRGTDKFREATFISKETVLTKTLDILKKKNPKEYKVFLATDVFGVKEFFKKALGDKLVISSKLFSKNDHGLHYQQRGYFIGKEALIDALLLSKCHFLIRTASNLSGAAAFFNPKLEIYNLTVTTMPSHKPFNKLNLLR